MAHEIWGGKETVVVSTREVPVLGREVDDYGDFAGTVNAVPKAMHLLGIPCPTNVHVYLSSYLSIKFINPACAVNKKEEKNIRKSGLGDLKSWHTYST